MRKKFKVYYPENHNDSELAGKQVRLGSKEMLVMNSDGVFFVYCGETYYPSIRKLSDKIGNYDVVWSSTEGKE